MMDGHGDAMGPELMVVAGDALSPPSPPAAATGVGPSSPTFAQPLWDGCIDRFHREAEERATRLTRENEQARKDLIDKLQQVLAGRSSKRTLVPIAIANIHLPLIR